jgi:hypothetical protein
VLKPRPGQENVFEPVEGDFDFSRLGELVQVEKPFRGLQGCGPTKLPDAITVRFITGSFFQADKIRNGAAVAATATSSGTGRERRGSRRRPEDL